MPEVMPPVFVISLPGSEERRARTQERLGALGIPFSFMDGVNGHALDIENLESYDGIKRRRYFGRDLKPGEVGCLLSHRKVYEKMVAENIECAAVFEDDVSFADDCAEVLRALPKMSGRWDLVRFLSGEKIMRRGHRRVARISGDYKLVRLPGVSGGAYGYMINLKAARALLGKMQKNWLPVDALHARAWDTGLETLAVLPSPVAPDFSFDTTIGEERFDKNIQVLGMERVVFPLARSWFKLCENAGKHYAYWGGWFKDKC